MDYAAWLLRRADALPAMTPYPRDYPDKRRVPSAGMNSNLIAWLTLEEELDLR